MMERLETQIFTCNMDRPSQELKIEAAKYNCCMQRDAECVFLIGKNNLSQFDGFRDLVEVAGWKERNGSQSLKER